jgi:23S rRNA (uracil1939-C5)-methyltransferase
MEVTIERILPGGYGLAHAEGKTVFVSLAAPGDVVRVSIDRVRGNIAFASIIEIIKPSEVRVEPPCPYFGRCGGCDFQQLNYQAQLDAKVEIIRDCLRRIAGIAEFPDIKIHAAPNQWQYRARANWQIDQATGAMGYFEAGSHRVCDVEVCAVLNPDLEEVLERIRAAIRAGTLTDLPRDIRAAAGADEVSVTPPVAGFQPADISRRFDGETYWFNADSFFQVNPDLLEALLDEAIGDEKGELAIDLYCGAGLFSLPLARRFARVIGVEVNSHATAFARRNLEAAQLSNAEVVTANVADWLREHADRSSQPTHSSVDPARSLSVDFLLLDPPRTGAENAVIKGIIALHPLRISYVSCDPATLARDLKKLLAAGYTLESVAAFDMFPQTHHLETIVHCRV